MTQAEEAIRLDVIDQLRWDTRVDISNIDVEVSGGTVKLTGTVLSCENIIWLAIWRAIRRELSMSKMRSWLIWLKVLTSIEKGN